MSDPRLAWYFDLDAIADVPRHEEWVWDRHSLEEEAMSHPEAPWDEPLDNGGVLDPGDTLADPERLVRVRVHTGNEDETREEHRAEDWLSEYGSRALDRYRHRREED